MFKTIEQLKEYICPVCEKMHTEVGVISEYDQILDLETGDYKDVNDGIGNTIGYFCPNSGQQFYETDVKELELVE